VNKNLICICGLCAVFTILQTTAVNHQWTEMSIVNSSDDPVLIKYSRISDGHLFMKFVEPGEALPFGQTVMATVQGAGTIRQYSTPAESEIFPPEGIDPIKSNIPAIIRIKGAKDSGVIHVGIWDVELVDKGTLLQIDPASFEIPQTKMILEVFPTVLRRLVATPRNILGLPSEAGVEDAIAAENILTTKWLMLKDTDEQTTKSVMNIIRILNDARKAFEDGKPDDVLKIAPNILYTKQELKEKKVMKMTTF